MISILDEDDDRDMAGSQDGSSDNDMDDTMRDADENEPEPDPEPEPEPEPEPDTSSNSSIVGSESQNRTNQNPEVLLTEPSPSDATPDNSIHIRPTPRLESLTANTYDIVPTVAAPHSTSVNAITATADMRWVFSGGSDGYVRKFNWADSINSKLMLTVAQRHPFVDSVVKAGVLMNYWENMDGNALSPVYSLASQAEGLWVLSGLESGNIRLQSVRHDEGKEIATLREHTSAVSTLCLSPDERSLLSGSWDKRVLDWDLDTGKVRRTFGSSLGQISALELRPESNIPIPQESGEYPVSNGTYSSNYRTAMSSIQNFVKDEPNDRKGSTEPSDPLVGSPADSLFEADSLFGDADGNGDADAPSGGAFAAEDDEFSQALPNGVNQKPQEEQAMEEKAEGDMQRSISQPNGVAPTTQTQSQTISESTIPSQAPPAQESETITNGVPEQSASQLTHTDDAGSPSATPGKNAPSYETGPNTPNDAVFLAASIDGTIRVWDRRQPEPVARVAPQNSPPWCMNACWSPDGNYIYAGRRNGVVEEFSLHKGLRNAERTLKFPQGSGAVSALRIMPNGRHLICASHDILRLYDLRAEQSSKHSTVPFLIIPGHRTGTISQLYMDPACRYLISTGGNRGWEGSTTEVLLGYEIGIYQSAQSAET